MLVKRLAKAVYRGTMAALHNPHSYLKRVTGVVHVGASSGQEREIYAKHNLKVLWIEPLPHMFATLSENIKGLPGQTAVNHLITDKNDTDYLFHISNNDDSSSILELARHKEIWPDVHYVGQISLKSVTLDTLLGNMGAASRSYQALVMDTQGSELLVLKGATKSLCQFKYIKTEAADFESYIGCATVDGLTDYLARFGFKLIRRDRFVAVAGVGQYFDLLFRRSMNHSSS